MTLNPYFFETKTENYFGKILYVLKAFGVSLYENDSMTYRVYSVMVLIFVNVLYPVLDTTELFRQDVDAYPNILMYDIPMTLAGLKASVLLRKRTEFRKLLLKLQQKPFVPNPDRGGKTEQKLLNECLWITTAQAYMYWGLGIISLGIGAIVVIVSRIRSDDYHHWGFAYGPLTFLNVTYSPNYEISTIYQNISACYAAMQFASIDLLAAALLAHVCFHFKIFQNSIRRIVYNSHEEILGKTKTASSSTAEKNHGLNEAAIVAIPWRYLKKHLARAIDYHLAILNVANEIERLFSNLLLTVFIGTLVMLCFLMYNTSSLSLSDPQLLAVVGGTLCTCVQVFAVCFWGEQVLFESQQVAEAAYDANFVGTDFRFQKSLALIIRRSQSPTQITAGKFAVICLATFAWLMRTSYSAFMVLRNANE